MQYDGLRGYAEMLACDKYALGTHLATKITAISGSPIFRGLDT